MKKKKAPKKKKTPVKKESGTLQQNASPVCYADNKDLREGYREEK